MAKRSKQIYEMSDMVTEEEEGNDLESYCVINAMHEADQIHDANQNINSPVGDLKSVPVQHTSRSRSIATTSALESMDFEGGESRQWRKVSNIIQFILYYIT